MLSAALLVQSLNAWTASPANVQERTHCKPLPTQLHTTTNNPTHTQTHAPTTTHSWHGRGQLNFITGVWDLHTGRHSFLLQLHVYSMARYTTRYTALIRRQHARPEKARCQCLHSHVGISQRYLHTVHRLCSFYTTREKEKWRE